MNRIPTLTRLITKKSIGVICIVIFQMMLGGCAQYRVVELERFSHTPGNATSDVITYAATRNNMIIPEYVVDRLGAYPVEPGIASARLNARKDDLDSYVTEKYAIESSVTYQTKRFFLGIGQLVVAPVVLLVMFIGDIYNREKTDESSHLTHHYVRSIFQNPIPQKPVIKNSYLLTGDRV